MSIPHLETATINTIALNLDEDVYGANGDLTDEQINEHLIENIRDVTDYQFGDLIPVQIVANLIRRVWEHEDRKLMDATAEAHNRSSSTMPSEDDKYTPRFKVRLLGLYCGCGRQVQAADFYTDGFPVRLVCGDCHRELLLIEREESGW